MVATERHEHITSYCRTHVRQSQRIALLQTTWHGTLLYISCFSFISKCSMLSYGGEFCWLSLLLVNLQPTYKTTYKGPNGISSDLCDSLICTIVNTVRSLAARGAGRPQPRYTNTSHAHTHARTRLQTSTV